MQLFLTLCLVRSAMAAEDGAFLGRLFHLISSKEQIPDLLVMYESVCKARTIQVVKQSSQYRKIFHIPDGDDQKERH